MPYQLDSVLTYGRLVRDDPTVYQEIQAALQKTGGNAVKTAKEIGTSHRTFCRWLDNFPKLRAMVEAARQKAIATGVEGRERSGRARPRRKKTSD
jgi:hypothetical protein